MTICLTIIKYKGKMIKRADINDDEVLAGLEIQMWEDHTLTELADT